MEIVMTDLEKLDEVEMLLTEWLTDNIEYGFEEYPEVDQARELIVKMNETKQVSFSSLKVVRRLLSRWPGVASEKYAELHQARCLVLDLLDLKGCAIKASHEISEDTAKVWLGSAQIMVSAIGSENTYYKSNRNGLEFYCKNYPQSQIGI